MELLGEFQAAAEGREIQKKDERVEALAVPPIVGVPAGLGASARCTV